ncbi:lymphocyte antigen 6D-like [Sardina pilchardus]|uniref:lymphocyte antigen 6D-like n=1 Tax=Sardina pilchardus TaxID=27697 RepID=UPI002E0D99B7
MRTIMCLAVAIVLVVSAAEALQCEQCSIGILGRCLFPDQVECDASSPNCYTGEAQFNATGFLKLHTRGCLDSDLCNETITGTILGAGFTSSFKCCTTDLCNGASAIHTPVFPLALSTALVAMAHWLS